MPCTKGQSHDHGYEAAYQPIITQYIYDGENLCITNQCDRMGVREVAGQELDEVSV